MQFSHALNPRRIARSLTAVLTLTLLQTVAAPIIAPTISVPKSNAVTGTFTATSSTSRSYITIPAGVESITLTITGGGGGQGGIDGDKSGGKGGMAQRVVASFAVSPGDVVALFPGNAGVNGKGGVNINEGGTGVGGVVAGGASTVTDSYWNVNGTSYQNPSFSGGAGGKVGAAGSSGSGGGGGAASVVAINRNIVAIAGGAGGGGGAGNATGAQGTDGVDANTPNSNLMYGGAGKDSGAGLTCSATDGGGGGGGGGGYFAGTGGNSELVGNECSGRGGFRGNALVYDALSSTVSSFNTSATPSTPLAGTITYLYDVKSPTVCAPTSTIVDIYTVLKFDASINCTWTVPSTVSVIDIFAVGGGGGGGDDGGTGGGGGAGLSRSAVPVTANSSVTIRVGYGGRAGNFNAWSSEFGETSSVTTSASTFNAPGGQGGGNRATGRGAGGSGAVNGTFAGGAGGLYPSALAVGGVGNFGISNYFYGTQNTYGGGGGGGCYFETGSNVTGASGRNGGGAGCSNTSATRQVDGIAGTAGTGGGGGGGGAGAAGRVMGGKGGSGVVLIRYATNAADSFPSSVSSALSARFSPGDLQVLDSTRKGWIDSSGGGATIAHANFTGSPYISTRGSTDGASQTDSSKTILVAKGGTGDRITLRDLPTNYTLFSISKYVTAGSNGRLITASGSNWFSGHYSGTNGCAHHGAWLTGADCNTTNLYGWQLNTDQVKYYRQNGVDVSMNQDAGWGNQNYLYNQSNPIGFGINNDPYGQNSTWEVADLLIFNRQLTAGEIRAVENWLARVNGLTLSKGYQSSETDTAVVMGGSNYFYGQYLNGMYINDTFTVEGWINPNAYCDGNTECPVFSYENVLVTRIYQGTFWYALYGDVSGWQWTDTKVKFQSGEWHHFALTKRLTGNQANAVDLYRDGKVAYVNSGTPYLNSAGNNGATNSSSDVVNTNDTWFYIGARAGTPRYYGQMDEIKIWKVARTADQIASDLNSTDATSPNLQLYYDFNRDALSDTFDLQNLAWGGHSRSDMVSVGTQTFQDVKMVSSATPYTTIKFPRNYLTQTGGWKVPESVTLASVIVVGGGGGSGKSASNTSAPGGSGGGGGVTYVPTQVLSSGAFVSVRVGTGGLAATTQEDDASTRNGFSSYLGVASGLTALGGGGGGSNGFVGAGGSTIATGGGGGGDPVGSSSCSTRGYSGGVVSTGYNGANGGWGWGGLGGSARGAATTTPSDCYGNPGPGFIDSITTTEYGQAGSNQFYANWISNTNYSTANNGWGGSVAYGTGAATNGVGFNGSSGVVIVRYITAAKPTYTKPTNAYLNVGMTETFTTNVAVDSATVGLTRTFKWESTTPTANGAYTTLKVGTGAANAAYSWVPTDTSTSGSGYLYRLTVTDSDTAGLFITDSSTAFAVINRALVVTSSAASNSLAKKINIARNETFTITFGTPTYRATLSPVIPGITIDTSTAGSVILKIAETATVGTWLETLTVTDSVSASIVIPLTIVVAAPPQLSNASEITKNGLIFDFDASNSASFNPVTSAMSDISGSKKTIAVAGGNSYSSDFSGILNFNSGAATGQYATATSFGQMSKYTVETYIRLNGSSVTEHFCPLVSEYTGSLVGFALCIDSGRTFYSGFKTATLWTFKRSAALVPLNTWTHLLGTFDGSEVRIYVDGVLVTAFAATDGQSTAGGLTPPIPSTDKVHINRTYTSTTTAATPGSASYGLIRLYNVGFTQTEVTSNFNAVKNRFTTPNLNQLAPSQKYGNLTQESFTATSGLDTKTVTFATGSRAGIKWDTTTVTNRVDLSIQESLTVGTYNDTITVTDSLGQSTFLPIRMTVTKADSLTVSMDTATSVSYNGSPITIYPRTTVKGFKSSDTATSLVRFSSSLYTESTVVPTNADTYTVRGAEPVFTIGSLSNYEGVIYETRTAVVRKINQRPLNIFKYGGTVGSGFIIQLQGGDGTGAVTETLTGVSTLTGCAISNRILTAAEQRQGFCEVRVVKAGDQNYFAETETAQLYFMTFVNNQPTGQVGSGSTIGLNGVTSFETSTVQAPSITGLSTLTLSLGAGGNFTITGTGFTGSVTIKFWRNKSISVTSGDGTTIVIPVSSIASAGATSGRIAVITAAGEGVSANSLTITP